MQVSFYKAVNYGFQHNPSTYYRCLHTTAAYILPPPTYYRRLHTNAAYILTLPTYYILAVLT